MKVRRKTVSIITVVVGLVASVVFAMAGARQGHGEQPGKRAEFMRQKLELAKNVLEGLTKEDFPLIAENAKKLRKLSEAAEFEVFTIPNTDYVRYSAEFQNLSGDLTRHAEVKNLDAATIAYNQLTLNCVNCHKFVRSQRNK